MEESQIRALERCMSRITLILKIDDVIPRLVEDGVLQDRDVERLESKRDGNERVEAFIFILQTKCKTAFQSFINALGEHVQYRILIKEIMDHIEIFHNNVTARDRSTGIGISEKKRKPPPVPPKRKPNTRPPPFPQPKPRPVPKPRLGHSSELHGDNTTSTTPSSEPSDVGKTAESKTCKEIARELKQRYFTPVTEDLGNCKFSELEAAKDKIMTAFEKEAQGSDKIAVKEELRTQLNTHLRLSEIPVADFAYTDAIETHRERLHNVVVEERYDNEVILKKFEEVDANILREFHDRCRGINPEKVQQNETLLRARMEDKKQHFLEVNKSLSHASCENLGSGIVASAHNECAEVMQKNSEISLHEKVDIIAKWNEIKLKYLSEYDKKAKGPTKEEVKDNCLREMEHDILRLEVAMSGNTLTMAINAFRTKISEMVDKFPLEEDDLIKRHDRIAHHVRELFCQRLSGFDERAVSGPKQVLEALTDQPEAQVAHANYQLSLNKCQEIANKTLQDTRELLDDLIPVLNIERDGILEKLDHLKDDAMKKYDSQAKGPGKDAFRMICEEGIDSSLRPRKKYLLLSRVQLMN